MGRIYLSVEAGVTDCTSTGCPFYGEGSCKFICRFCGIDCNEVDLSTLRRCEDGEVVAVK